MSNIKSSVAGIKLFPCLVSSATTLLLILYSNINLGSYRFCSICNRKLFQINNTLFIELSILCV